MSTGLQIDDFANRGDRIETETSTGKLLLADLVTAESCAYGNELIVSGRWRLWKCPCCQKRWTQCKNNPEGPK